MSQAEAGACTETLGVTPGVRCHEQAPAQGPGRHTWGESVQAEGGAWTEALGASMGLKVLEKQKHHACGSQMSNWVEGVLRPGTFEN